MMLTITNILIDFPSMKSLVAGRDFSCSLLSYSERRAADPRGREYDFLGEGHVWGCSFYLGQCCCRCQGEANGFTPRAAITLLIIAHSYNISTSSLHVLRTKFSLLSILYAGERFR